MSSVTVFKTDRKWTDAMKQQYGRGGNKRWAELLWENKVYLSISLQLGRKIKSLNLAYDKDTVLQFLCKKNQLIRRVLWAKECAALPQGVCTAVSTCWEFFPLLGFVFFLLNTRTSWCILLDLSVLVYMENAEIHLSLLHTPHLTTQAILFRLLVTHFLHSPLIYYLTFL